MKALTIGMLVLLVVLFIWYLCLFLKKETYITPDIPIVIICYNNAFFVKNFVNQVKRLNRKIIILNNNSKQPELYEYFTQIKKELGDNIEIRTYDKNYGHDVYLILRHTLPELYILSDPDLELNQNLPDNCIDILYQLSNKYKVFKVGFALDISEKDKLIHCEKNVNFYDVEKKYWETRIKSEKKFELYRSPLDTTFCLVNFKYYNPQNKYDGIRIAGNFCAKHLPWYKDYIRKNIPPEELKLWKENNVSSSILNCTNL